MSVEMRDVSLEMTGRVAERAGNWPYCLEICSKIDVCHYLRGTSRGGRLCSILIRVFVW